MTKGKRVATVARVAVEVRIGKRVLVVTPSGNMDGRQWLASIGHTGAHKAAFMAELAEAVGKAGR